MPRGVDVPYDSGDSATVTIRSVGTSEGVGSDRGKQYRVVALTTVLRSFCDGAKCVSLHEADIVLIQSYLGLSGFCQDTPMEPFDVGTQGKAS